METDAARDADRSRLELTVDELARRTDVPVRTIREYQTIGVLPAPDKRGRVGIYGETHVARLALVERLQQRGYSLAGIRDLLGAWREGAHLGEILGLEPDQLVHVDEPGAPVELDQLERLLPALVPTRLAELIETGIVEACGPDRYCVPSPSLLQLTIDTLATGYDTDRVLDLLGVIGRAAETIADSVHTMLTDPPATADDEHFGRLATRGRGLLAHGVGRLTIHTLGRRLGVTDETAVPDALGRLLEGDRK
jgi:DNA-binding transcriptional MerR regulator